LAFISIAFVCRDTILAMTDNQPALSKSGVGDLATNEASPYDEMIVEAAGKYGVDPQLVRLVIGKESGYKPRARSQKNAQGLMQLIPETAKRFGIKNPYDPQQNIDGGTRYLKWLLDRFDGDVKLALAGYNAGEQAVKRFGNQVPPYKETRQYVNKIATAYGSNYHMAPAQKVVGRAVAEAKTEPVAALQ
jgi:soluble lytic murein transglycosylase-like protein